MNKPQITIPNLNYLKTRAETEGISGQKLSEAFEGVAKVINNNAAYLSQNVTGSPSTPPNISSVVIRQTASEQIHVSIIDNSPTLQQAVSYYVEGTITGDWNDSYVLSEGSSRDHFISLPYNGSWQLRAYSQYKTGGGPNIPIPASGNILINSLPNNIALPSQSSGTGLPGTAGNGAGKVQTRT